MKSKLSIALLMLPLLAGCVPQQEYQQEVQQVQTLQYLNSTYAQLNQNLESEVAADQVKIKQLQNRLQVTLVNQILFREGGWELNASGRATLNKVVPALQGLTGKRIIIEGYTDNLPIEEPLKRRFPNNWSLAAARAISVVEYLESQGIDPTELSVASYGKYHPVASNDTREGRTRNRRIEIVIEDQNI